MGSLAGVSMGMQAQGCVPSCDPLIDDQPFDDFDVDFEVREAAAAPQKVDIADVLQSENAAIVAQPQIAAPKLADACAACT